MLTTVACSSSGDAAASAHGGEAGAMPAAVDASDSCADGACAVADGGLESGELDAGSTPGFDAATVCNDGGCYDVLATGVRPLALAVNSTKLYFSNLLDDGSQRLLAMPVTGGQPALLGSSTSVDSLLLDDTSLYWTGSGIAGGIFALPLAGGLGQRLGSDPALAGLLAVDRSVLYFMTADAQVTGTHGALKALPLGGGAPSTVVTTDPVRPDDAALDPARTTLYFSTRLAGTDDSSIVALALAGGTPTTLVTVTDAQSIRGITVDATNVYWAIANYADGPPKGGSLWKKPRLGGDALRLSSWSVGFPAAVALDGSALYVVSTRGGYGTSDAEVRRVSVADGSSTVLAARGGNAIAVGAGRVFVGDEGAGVLFSVAK